MRYNHWGVISDISPLPGCDTIAVLNSVWMPVAQREQGFGTIAHAVRLEEAKHLGYQQVICTVHSENKAEKAILAKYRWMKVSEYVSNKTGHTVETYVKVL